MLTRRKIAAAFDRSGWARLAFIVVTLLTFWAGMGLLFALPVSERVAGLGSIVWMFLVCGVATWVVMGPGHPLTDADVDRILARDCPQPKAFAPPSGTGFR